MTHRVNFLQHRLHIPQIVHKVRQHDHIERLRPEIQLMRIATNELHGRMPFLRPLDHFIGPVNADGSARLQRRQQIPLSAADLKHAQPRGNDKSVNLRQPAVVIRPGAAALIRLPRDGVPMRQARIVIRLGGRVMFREVDGHSQYSMEYWMGSRVRYKTMSASRSEGATT